MVSGKNPFQRESASETFSAILRDQPPLLSERVPGIPEELSAIVRKALSKKPEDRHATARQFAAELRSARARLDSSLSAAQFAPAPTRRSALYPMIGLAAVVVLVAVLLLRRDGGKGESPVALPAGRLAVAVLPIRNNSGDSQLEQAHVGEILRNAFVQLLSDYANFYVVSPLRLDSAAASLKRPLPDAEKDAGFAKKVCKKAGATAMLSGNLAMIGDTYVLAATLREIPSEHLRGTFRAESQNRERLLPDLVGQVSETLRRKLAPSAPADSLEHVATTNVAAYEHYVRGQDLDNEGNWKAAIPELKKALELDPTMALAWTELSCAYSFAGQDPESVAAFRKGQEFADRLNAKERRWMALNEIWVLSKNGALYRREAQSYIRDYPDDRQGYFYLGLGQEYLDGDFRGALVSYEKAFMLTPAYYPVTKAIVDCHLKLKRQDLAIAALKRYLELPFLGNHGRRQPQWRLGELTKSGANEQV